MIDLEEFNSSFFDGSFDEAAIFTPSGGAPVSVGVIFDAPYSGVPFRDASGAEIESSAPSALVRDADVPGVAHGDTLTVRGTVYRVVEVHPDGTGLTTLILSQDE